MTRGPGADPEEDPLPARGGAYDYHGRVRPEYAPERDGDPDPGEVVWAWVPYEELDGRGKDRPLAVIGRALDSDDDLVVLMLSSRDHDRDPGWVGIGPGGWDRDGRPSWVRADRVLAVSPEAVRREGAQLSRAAFDAVVAAARHESG